jgi:hypothetical protein
MLLYYQMQVLKSPLFLHRVKYPSLTTLRSFPRTLPSNPIGERPTLDSG